MTSAGMEGARPVPRVDIQALRGFAVLIVVAYHAKLGILPSGFLGVDVFFVISGFLITGLIARGIEDRRFSLSDFYWRRAKRLLPAAYVTFTATLAAAPFFLASSEMRDLSAQLTGAVSFTANFALWRQSGYFLGPAELKPFLHTWSLAIEEQFYFLLPATLLVLPRRTWTSAIVGAVAISLALCFVRPASDAGFYLLPTRAWELGLGAIAARVAARQGRSLLTPWLGAFAFGVLLVLPLLPTTGALGRHPGATELGITIATALLLLHAYPRIADWPLGRSLARVGDGSYSLYLVHWPIFAFANNVWMGGAEVAHPLPLTVGCLGLSFLLAWALHRWVEAPIHRSSRRPSRGIVVATLALTVGLILTARTVSNSAAIERFSELRRPNRGFGPECDMSDRFTVKTACTNSATPSVLVWGDSYAMHLVPGLLNTSTAAPGLVQATRSVCGPVRGVAMMRAGPSDRRWAESCLEFSESVLDHLRRTESIHTVVLASAFYYYVTDTAAGLLERPAPSLDAQLVASDPAVVFRGLRRTADAIRAMGKRVVLVLPLPVAPFDAGRCNERAERGLPMLGAPADCAIVLRDYRARYPSLTRMLAEMEAATGIATISFMPQLCDATRCQTRKGDVTIYNDAGHFSVAGANWVARESDLASHIARSAR